MLHLISLSSTRECSAFAVRVFFHDTKDESCELNYLYTIDHGFYELRLYFHMRVYASRQLLELDGIKWLSRFDLVLSWFRVPECLSERHQGLTPLPSHSVAVLTR